MSRTRPIKKRRGGEREWTEADNHALVEEIRAQYKRAYRVLCPFGNCTIDIDPVNNQIITAIGPVGCLCDNLPGWRSHFYDGLPKPAWGGKACGRYADRIRKSQQAKAEVTKFFADLFQKLEVEV